MLLALKLKDFIWKRKALPTMSFIGMLLKVDQSISLSTSNNTRCLFLVLYSCIYNRAACSRHSPKKHLKMLNKGITNNGYFHNYTLNNDNNNNNNNKDSHNVNNNNNNNRRNRSRSSSNKKKKKHKKEDELDGEGNANGNMNNNNNNNNTPRKKLLEAYIHETISLEQAGMILSLAVKKVDLYPK